MAIITARQISLIELEPTTSTDTSAVGKQTSPANIRATVRSITYANARAGLDITSAADDQLVYADGKGESTWSIRGYFTDDDSASEDTLASRVLDANGAAAKGKLALYIEWGGAAGQNKVSKAIGTIASDGGSMAETGENEFTVEFRNAGDQGFLVLDA